MKVNSIEEVVEALKKGEIVIVTDEPDRENEGDMIQAAEFATGESLNTMASLAKGLICMPMSKEYAEKFYSFCWPRGHNYWDFCLGKSPNCQQACRRWRKARRL